MIAAVMLTTVGHAQAVNILFYGNSFTLGTGSNKSVSTLVSEIAVAAGHPAPYVRNAAVGGQNFAYHLTNNLGVINSGIAAGQNWDYVVLQDYSNRTTHVGNLPQHRADAVALRNAVAAHSPGVTAVMFETWAYEAGHSYYPGTFADPAAMQQEIRDGYNLSAGDINAAAGPGSAVVAPVGDAWENANWDRLHVLSDKKHAINRGTLLASLVIYARIYDDDTTRDIDLSGVLSGLGLTATDGEELTTAADAALVPEPASLGALCLGVLAVSVRRW